MKTRSLVPSLICLVAVLYLAGCGGGGGTREVSPPPSASRGALVFTIRWPQPGRLIPVAAQSIRVRLTARGAFVAEKLEARPPAGQTTSAVTFADLPTTNITVSATAYPEANGTGTPLASGSLIVAVVAGTTSASLTLDSAIDRVQIAPGSASLKGGESAQLAAAALDSHGSVVLTDSGKWTWTTSDPAVAALTPDGSKATVTAEGNGQATITATETESGKSASITATVVVPGPLTFLAPVSYDVAAPGGDLATADLDGDGILDLFAVGGHKASLLFGKGDGTFEAAVSLAVADYVLEQGLPADLNADGKPDLVICGGDTVNKIYVFQNAGSRSFVGPVAYTVGTKPFGVCADDLDGDGYRDLVVANNGSHSFSVLMNKADGTFSAAVNTASGGSYPKRVLTPDLDGDGKLDLIITNMVSDNVALFRGDGKGGFAAHGTVGVGSYAAGMALGDYDRDGKVDLAVANTYSHNVSILRGASDGSFASSGTYAANTYSSLIAASDLDGDGDVDLAVSNNGQEYFTVLTNDGAGAFQQTKIPSGGKNSRTLAVGDYNHDGKPDVAVGCEDTNNVTVHLNATTYNGALDLEIR